MDSARIRLDISAKVQDESIKKGLFGEDISTEINRKINKTINEYYTIYRRIRSNKPHSY